MQTKALTMTRLLSIGMVLMTATTGTIMAQKQTPPEGGTPKDFVLPESITFSLENGLQATLIPYGALPKVTVRAVIRAGNINEGPNEVWLADLLGDFLEEGTTTKDARTIAEEAAGMGGEIGVSVSEDQTTVSSSVLSEFGPEIVALIADVVRNPALPESELQRLRNDRIRELSIQMADPNSIALQRFRSLLYPDHPYGRLFPTEEMLKSYTIGQVRQFHQANIGAARTHIYVAGKFDAREMENAIRKAFSDWTRGSEPLVMVPSPRSAREIHILNRPGAPQSTVYLGLPTIDPSKPDYRPLLVMNALLGGSFMSRITSNIREDKGYTYSPSSSVSSRYRDAYWQQFASITTDVTGAALHEIFFEIKRLQDEAPGEDELKGIQNYLAGIFVLQNSSPGGLINLLSLIHLHGLPASYLSEYVRTIYAVTPQDVQRLAREYLDTNNMMLVIAGDRKTLEKQVAPFGRIVPSQADKNP